VTARLARVLLVVALLAGWQSALKHAIEHVDELGQLVHRHSSHSDEDGSVCDSLAALTAVAAEAPFVYGTYPPAFEVTSHPIQAPRVAQAPPFLSQGPPIASV
jgi:hypothetical protein